MDQEIIRKMSKKNETNRDEIWRGKIKQTCKVDPMFWSFGALGRKEYAIINKCRLYFIAEYTE